jgi:hypothetical protein
MIERQQQEPRGLIFPVVCFISGACFRMPYGTVQASKLDCLVLGTYVFPLAMFFLAFATQYFPDLSSGFWFKESQHATTMGFSTTSILSKPAHHVDRFAHLLIRFPAALRCKRFALGGIVASLALYPRG